MTTIYAIPMILWLSLLCLTFRPWSTREEVTCEAQEYKSKLPDLTSITVLIPARNEAQCVATTLQALALQGHFKKIILVDDQSTDGTGEIAENLGIENLVVLRGSSPPPGWTGKLWALHQASTQTESPLLLLLDADIELAPGLVPKLLELQKRENKALVSVMAQLSMISFWEKLLLPPFIYFFKLIYPFALSNNKKSRVAAAAGGVVLITQESLKASGGFQSIGGAIIDDCTLAKQVKQSGGLTWIGLTQSAKAIRPYNGLDEIWNMVARTAFAQLSYSSLLLLLCTVLMLVSFVLPLAALKELEPLTSFTGGVALAAMYFSFAPTIRFYKLPFYWILTLPFAALLFLMMTWTSAVRFWAGEKSSWKERSYSRED